MGTGAGKVRRQKAAANNVAPANLAGKAAPYTKTFQGGTSGRLKDVDRERAIERLARRVQTIVEESGDPEGFDARRWTEAFLVRPMPALGGKTPNEFMGTEEGQALIENLISRMQSGGYA